MSLSKGCVVRIVPEVRIHVDVVHVRERVAIEEPGEEGNIEMIADKRIPWIGLVVPAIHRGGTRGSRQEQRDFLCWTWSRFRKHDVNKQLGDVRSIGNVSGCPTVWPALSNWV